MGYLRLLMDRYVGASNSNVKDRSTSRTNVINESLARMFSEGEYPPSNYQADDETLLLGLPDVGS